MQVEKLIKELPSVPADGSDGHMNLEDRKVMSNSTSLQPVENGMNIIETQSMLLERIASEMNRLKFYIAHAQVSFSIIFFWLRPELYTLSIPNCLWPFLFGMF